MSTTASATTSPNADLVIEASDLVKTYPGGVRALDGLSFSVRRGAVFGLLGPNGAGKSTSVKVLTTLARPDSGSALVDGINVTTNPNRVRASIGVVAQRSGVDRQATGRENMRLQGRLHGMTGKRLEQRIDGLLQTLDLADAADRVARGYSGGMQRRLDIGMGLVHRPRVLFLDEPTTGLDPEVRAGMWSEIAQLAHGEGLTILLTTHYLEEADQLADELAIVDRGRVVATGTPDSLKAELDGDAISVLLPEAPADGAVGRALDGINMLTSLSLDGRNIRARTEDGASAVPVVLAALQREGVTAQSVTIARPSLDDVYLRYTGRSFAHEDQQEEGHE